MHNKEIFQAEQQLEQDLEIIPDQPDSWILPINPTNPETPNDGFDNNSDSGDSETVDIDKEDITLHIDEVIPEEKRPTLKQSEIESENNYPEILQNIIEESGSTLSSELCSQLISELQKTLARPLTIEDVKSAANFFVKHDSL